MEPIEPIYRTGFRTRGEPRGPVTCDACGCRLQPAGSAGPGERWVHFGAMGGRDARGCRVACVDLVHDSSGRTELLTVA